jgi:peptidyl-prolyl cis-trans isomerase D
MVLDSFRRFGATSAAKILLFTLILAFAAWGIEGFLQAQRSPHGLTVNGVGISLVELDEQYKQRLQSIEQRLGQPLTAEQRAGLNLGPQLVAETAARSVLRQTAAALHLAPATRTLQTEIANLPPFKDERGNFDATKYRAGLAQMGRTPAQFEAEMAHDLAVRNLSQLVYMAPLPTQLAAQYLALAGQQTSLEVATVALIPISTVPSAEELEKFYALNPKTYEVPEHRSGVALIVNATHLSGTLSIPSSRIEAEYQANQAAYSAPETRKVRHILLPSLASATALQGQIKTLDDFMRLANQHSIDPGNQKTRGGDLGYITKAEVVPSFAEMAFSIPVGTLSARVQSPFGWHLIWVEDIKPARVRPLAEVRADIEKQLRTTELTETLNNLSSQADEQIAGGATLAEVAKKLGLPTTPIARTQATDEGTEPALLAALFATASGQVSAPVNLPDGVAYIETTRIEPAAVPALATIQPMVQRDWQALQAELNAQRATEKLLAAARAPAAGPRTLAEAARQAAVHAPIKPYKLSENDMVPNWLRARLTELSALPVGQTLPTVLRDDSGWHVVRVTARTTPALITPTPEAMASLTNELRADLEALLVGYLQAGAKITCYAAGLQQVFGAPMPCPNGTR